MIREAVMALSAVLCGFLSARCIFHFFQLESYQFPGFFRTLRRNPEHCLVPGLAAALCSFLYFGLYHLITEKNNGLFVTAITSVLLIGLAFLTGMLIRRKSFNRNAKKKFVITGRIKRLYAVFITISAVIAYFTAHASWIAGALWLAALPLVVALAGLLAWPIEKAISECYFRSARHILLSNQDAVRIGITGSYGKTSVKHILYTLLNEKYPTFKTPRSFNTPMGVSRAIREGFQPSHRIFLGEMGARHVGDIKEMCRLVRPTIGLITSVGPQHLETFKTIERIAKTKYELIDALPETGHAYFSDDNGIVRGLYQKTQKPATLCGNDPAVCDCYYQDVKADQNGLSFTLHFRDGQSVDCRTRLLGEHNIRNITLAAAVALNLGLSPKQIQRGIEKLQPIENRLQLMQHPGSYTVINDAFNTNPVSAKMALDTLRQFPSRRIIITPGMIELGKDEEEYNREFGRQMADAVDIAIVVGHKRVQPIMEGLKEKGFPEENIYRVDSLDESTTLLRSFVLPTDTVMYENDLPDHYQEA